MSDHMKAYRRRIEDARFSMGRASADQVELQELRLEVEALEAEIGRQSERLAIRDAHIDALKIEVERLAELVDDLTLQGTYGEHDANTLDSGAISAYAEGLRDMARRGRVRVTHEKHRRVIAVFTEEELERQRAVVDAARAALPQEAPDG